MEFEKLSGDILRHVFDKIIGRVSPALIYAEEVKSMNAKKEEQTLQFRNWLMNSDINFRECANGQFNIYDEQNKLVFTVWATTGRMIDTTNQQVVSYDLEQSKKMIFNIL